MRDATDTWQRFAQAAAAVAAGRAGAPAVVQMQDAAGFGAAGAAGAARLRAGPCARRRLGRAQARSTRPARPGGSEHVDTAGAPPPRAGQQTRTTAEVDAAERWYRLAHATRRRRAPGRAPLPAGRAAVRRRPLRRRAGRLREAGRRATPTRPAAAPMRPMPRCWRAAGCWTPPMPPRPASASSWRPHSASCQRLRHRRARRRRAGQRGRAAVDAGRRPCGPHAGAAGAARPDAGTDTRRQAHAVIGDVALASQDPAGAEQAYAQVLALLPADPTPQGGKAGRTPGRRHLPPGRSRTRAGRTADAARHFARVGRQAPNSSAAPAALYDGALQLIALKDWAGATRRCRPCARRTRSTRWPPAPRRSWRWPRPKGGHPREAATGAGTLVRHAGRPRGRARRALAGGRLFDRAGDSARAPPPSGSACRPTRQPAAAGAAVALASGRTGAGRRPRARRTGPAAQPCTRPTPGRRRAHRRHAHAGRARAAAPGRSAADGLPPGGPGRTAEDHAGAQEDTLRRGAGGPGRGGRHRQRRGAGQRCPWPPRRARRCTRISAAPC
jgi:hypothetical protein